MRSVIFGFIFISMAAIAADKAQPPIPIISDVVGDIIKEQKSIILTPQQVEELKPFLNHVRQM